MEVKLIAYTSAPESTCAKAMKSCRTKEPAFELDINNPEYYIKLAKRLGHLSVLEHASFTFSVEGITRVCTHQLVRHRIASYSQQSQRSVGNYKINDWLVPYSITKSDYFNKMVTIAHSCINLYNEMINNGIPKEDARFILPAAILTNIVITMNARELRHFFELRLAKSAQWEIKDMARLMLEEVKKVAPTIFGDIK